MYASVPMCAVEAIFLENIVFQNICRVFEKDMKFRYMTAYMVMNIYANLC